MDYTQSFAISAVGMNIERTRVDVAALNLANANTVQAPGAAGYQPLRVIADARMAGAAALRGSAFGGLVSEGLNAAAQAVPQVQVVPAQIAPRLVYEPGHPSADARGFVAYAGVDPATEMVSFMSATRAYEANVAAMNTARTLALRALEIGSGT
jgi:flagellar basal-body rod protein FlgC